MSEITQIQVGNTTYDISGGGTKVVTEDGKTSIQAVTNLGFIIGSTRGYGAVDLQMQRTSPSQVASGAYSVVAGTYNTASGFYSVAIGTINYASDFYSVAIGDTNNAYGYCSIAIGEYNQAESTCSVIAGGRYNAIDSSANYAFIGGGHYNTALGAYSSIIGGESNRAEYKYSVACGQYCRNPFPSIATNHIDDYSNSLESGIIGHSGKLSLTVRGFASPPVLMDFTNLMFSGVLKIHYVIYGTYGGVVLIEQTIYIADNEIVYSVYTDGYDAASNWHLTGSAFLNYMDEPMISNRILYGPYFYNAQMVQIGMDYTCLSEKSSGGGYYDYYDYY